MRVESKVGDRQWDEYVVDMEDGRKAFLTVRQGSHPLRVDAGSAKGGAIATHQDAMAAVKEAGDWLVAEIKAGRA